MPRRLFEVVPGDYRRTGRAGASPAELAIIKSSMEQSMKRLIALADVLLVAPAVLFMAAIFLRSAFPPAEPAQALVHWYEARIWTLWLLPFGLPAVALLTGLPT